MDVGGVGVGRWEAACSSAYRSLDSSRVELLRQMMVSAMRVWSMAIWVILCMHNSSQSSRRTLPGFSIAVMKSRTEDIVFRVLKLTFPMHVLRFQPLAQPQGLILSQSDKAFDTLLTRQITEPHIKEPGYAVCSSGSSGDETF